MNPIIINIISRLSVGCDFCLRVFLILGLEVPRIKMKKLLFKIFTLTVVFSAQISFANASIIFQSAESPAPNPTPNLGAQSVSNEFHAFHRFFLDDTYQIDSVGGYFDGNFQESTIFGALIGLTNAFDLPDSFDFSTPDLLATTLLNVGQSDGDYTGVINITLSSGWYAVAFGAGRFGADDTFASLSNLEVDLAPSDLPITSVTITNRGGAPRFVFQAVSTRFFVTGSKVNEVPVPNTISLFIVGMLMLFTRKKLLKK